MNLSVINKLKMGLTKTRAGLVQGLTRVVSGSTQFNEDMLAELEETLILGDVGVGTAEFLIERLRTRSRIEKIHSKEDILQILKQELVLLLQVDNTNDKDYAFGTEKKPFVISVVGVNGTGKTTTIGKLAYYLRRRNATVLVAAADTFRAAASEQLQIWAMRAGADIIKNLPGADPASVAYDALSAARARKIDILIIDTAGRLHTKINLMGELQKIHRVLGRGLAGAPQKIIMVLDATTGQNGMSQARQFTKDVDINEIIITKLDGTAKGGVIFSIVHELQIPIRFVGVGEGIDDLEKFEPNEFIEALFQ